MQHFIVENVSNQPVVPSHDGTKRATNTEHSLAPASGKIYRLGPGASMRLSEETTRYLLHSFIPCIELGTLTVRSEDGAALNPAELAAELGVSLEPPSHFATYAEGEVL